MAVTQRLRNSDGGEDREEVLKSLDNLLSELTTGVFVDPIFNSISGFTFEGASKIFKLLEIPLYHGWIIDPMNPAQLAIGNFSYNNLMPHLLEMNDDGNKVVIEEFLKSQLTVTGLESLRAMIKEDEPCILYSNDHFHTLVNRPEAGLFTLVTDIGFQNRPNHVWQRLESVNGVNGPTDFYNANFKPTNPRSEVEKLDEKGSSQIRISVFYDMENIRATSNAYAAVRKFKDALCVYFPGAIPSLKAIGNTTRIQDVERLACDGHGFTIIDVPRKTRNAADIRIMVEMFRSALEYPAPGFMMLLSGDGDFCEAFECIGRLGFTTVLVYPEASVASELIDSSDFAFSWNELCKGRGLVDKNGSRSSDVPLDHKVVVKTDHGRRLVFFWDIHAYPLPTQEPNVHQFVTHRLGAICYEREANYDKEKALFYAFGHPRTFPPAEVCKAIGNYIPTFKSKKKQCTENKMLVQILSVALDMKTPGHFVILTRNQDYSSVIHFLREKGHVVTTAIPSGLKRRQRLQDAATYTIEWPWIKVKGRVVEVASRTKSEDQGSPKTRRRIESIDRSSKKTSCSRTESEVQGLQNTSSRIESIDPGSRTKSKHQDAHITSSEIESQDLASSSSTSTSGTSAMMISQNPTAKKKRYNPEQIYITPGRRNLRGSNV